MNDSEGRSVSSNVPRLYIFIHQLVVAKKIQYIHTYKYKEIQQTRKKQGKNRKCNVQVFMAKCNYVQNQYSYINISLIHANT